MTSYPDTTAQARLQSLSDKPRFDVCILTCLLDVLNSHTHHYANSLFNKGRHILVIAPGELNGAPANFSHLSLPPVNQHFMPYRTRMLDLLKALAARGRNTLLAAWYLIRCRPRVVMCSELDGLAIAVALKPFLQHKVVADVREIHEDRLRAFPGPLQKPLLWLLQQTIRALIYGTDEVIHMNAERQSFYGYCSKAGLVVSYYPRRDLYNWADKRVLVRSRKAPREHVNVVQAGPLRLSYAADELIQAIDEAARQDPRVRCFVLGGFIDSVSNFKHEKLLRQLQRDKKLIITPLIPLKRVVSFLKIADIGVNLVKPVDLAHRFAQPRKLYEYLAAGLPVIGSDVPTIASVIKDCECGLVVNPASPKKIANAILRLANDDEFRQKCAENAIAAAHLKYCWETQESVFRGIFDRLLAQSRPNALSGWQRGSLPEN